MMETDAQEQEQGQRQARLEELDALQEVRGGLIGGGWEGGEG